MRQLLKATAILLANLMLIATLQAQTLAPTTDLCGFDQRHQQRMRTDAGYAHRVNAFNARNHEADVAGRDAGTLFVPLVFHVLEDGTSNTAITDDQIRTVVRWLNERYRKVTGTLGAGNGVDTHIEFALAVRDVSGNCTTGITRHNLSGNAAYVNNGVVDGTGLTDDDVKAIGGWNPLAYYNVWLVNSIDGANGYAYLSGSHGQYYDGAVIRVSAVLSSDATTLAHELGHALNLYHTFEGDNDGLICPPNGSCSGDGDLVCDTPPHIRSASNCNEAGTNSCDGGSSNMLYVHNYLNYSNSACRNMFTAGQDTRLQSGLTVGRASLLAANGNMSLVPPGVPVMDMLASTSLLCGTGQSVQFFDRSSCIPNTYLRDPDLPGISFAWTITNGNETHSPTEQNPVVTLNSTGIYNVTLQVTTGLGTYTRTETGMVVVVAAPVAGCTPTSVNPSGNYHLTVNRVVFNTLDNATDEFTSFPYTDFACTKNTVVARGSTYSLAVTLAGTTTNTEIFQAYIDWNNNGSFENPSELVGSGSQGNGTGTTTVNVTIPITATLNTLLRMRIYGESGSLSANERTCTAALLVGDVEDYGVYVSTNIAAVSIAAAPGSAVTYGTNVTFTPTPVNGGASPTYTWYRNGAAVTTAPTYASNTFMPGETVHCSMVSNLAGVIASPALSNTITMNVTGAPLSDFSGTPRQICAGSSVTFTDASLLLPTSWSWSFTGGTPSTSTAQNPVITYNTPGTYPVTLTASNSNGTGTIMTKTAYITVYAIPAVGCTVTRSMAPAAGIGVNRFKLNTIDNSTVTNGPVMNDYTCSHLTTLTAGSTYNIEVYVGPSNNQWVRVYIDYAGNGNFTQAGELIFSPANGMGLRSGSFVVPASPVLANTLLRLRVITDFVNTTPGSCTNLQYGEVEEYGVVITVPLGIAVAPKVFLGGSYNATTGIMGDGLRSAGIIPATEPYTALGYTFAGGGGETVAPAVLAVTGNNAIADWVVVEVRDNTSPATVLASKSALVQRDGDVVATDGTSPVSFALAANTYRVAVRHRNHLGAMTLNGVALSLSAATVDLTSSGTATYGTNARESISGAFPAQVLWRGDVTFDGAVKYTGANNDRDPILVYIGGTVPTNTVNGYHNTDVTLDGVTKYTGANNDRDPILVTIGGTVPTNVLLQQLP